MVYITEAHAIDGSSPMVRRGSPLIEEPISFDERYEIAGQCVVGLSLQRIPAVVDGIDNKVGSAYQGHPDRLYLVGVDGRIAYAGGRGPRGFDPNALEGSIKVELAKPKE
jgi:hypothetical protein